MNTECAESPATVVRAHATANEKVGRHLALPARQGAARGAAVLIAEHPLDTVIDMKAAVAHAVRRACRRPSECAWLTL